MKTIFISKSLQVTLAFICFITTGCEGLKKQKSAASPVTRRVDKNAVQIVCSIKEAENCHIKEDGADTGNKCIKASGNAITPFGYRCDCNMKTYIELRTGVHVTACQRVRSKEYAATQCTEGENRNCFTGSQHTPTGNTCIRKDGKYICRCKIPEYDEVMSGPDVVGCLLGCDERQKTECVLVLNGQPTQNKCVVDSSDKAKHVCECLDSRYEPQPKEGDASKCVLASSSSTNCSEFQNTLCESTDPASGNKCEIPNENKPTQHICKCKKEHETVTNEKGEVVGCGKEECNILQNKACQTTNPDGTRTKNTCSLEPLDPSKTVCNCLDPDFVPVVDASGSVYECNRKEGCSKQQEELCQLEDSDNQCYSQGASNYVCQCNDPFTDDQINEDGAALACIKLRGTCTYEQEVFCVTTSATGANTGNSCFVPNMLKPSEITCVCDGKGYKPGRREDNVVIECEEDHSLLICEADQKRKCVLVDPRGYETENLCFITNPDKREKHECICEDPYKPEISPGSDLVDACVIDSDLGGLCTDEQDEYCQVYGKDNVLTMNKCRQIDVLDTSKYVCECKDERYTAVKDMEGLSVNCTKKGCGEVEEEACKVEAVGKATGNRCILPDLLKPDDYSCICMMPYFPNFGGNKRPRCDKLPAGEFYLERPEDQTVLEGGTVTFECIVDRTVNECRWERGDHPVSPTHYLNDTSHYHKYTFVGHACDGICSLVIRYANLAHDKALWTCRPILDDTFIPPAKAYLHVVVPPSPPKLVYDGKTLEEGALVYVGFGRAHLITLTVDCVSESSYPPAIHEWLQDGDLIEQTISIERQDIMAETYTTISTATFTMKKSNRTTIQCITTSNATDYQVVMATFVSTAPTREVNIIYLLDEDWFQPPHGVVLMNYPEETMLQCVADGRPEPRYTWQEQVDGKWLPVGFFEPFIVTTNNRILRCLAGNDENSQLVMSSPVSIQSKGGNAVVTIPNNVPQFYRFLHEPDNKMIGPGANFFLDCQLNGPVHTCLWTRRNLGKNTLQVLPDLTFTGSKEDGSCTIQIMEATSDSLGGWVCQLVLFDGTVMRSREAIVGGLHFDMLPDEHTDDDWRFHPQLKINGEVVAHRQLVVLNHDDPTKLMADVLAECSAYARTDSGKVKWDVGDKSYQQFTSVRFPIPSDPPLFIIYGTMTFVLSSALKTLALPHPVLMELGCNVVGRKSLSLVDGEWSYLKNNEIRVLLTLQHPTYDIVVIPPGPIKMRNSTSVLLNCKSNGFPPPSINWQEYLEDEDLWVTLSDVYGASLVVLYDGQFRCTAGNIYNTAPAVSLPISVELGSEEEEYEEVSNCAACFTFTSILWSLANVQILQLLHNIILQ